MTGTRGSSLFKVAIVGATSLKGKEVRDILGERNFPTIDIKLLDEDESLGQLEQVNDEPTFVQGVDAEHLSGVDFAFLAADTEEVARHLDVLRRAGADLVDLSSALEKMDGAELRAPWVERELGRRHEAGLQSRPALIAHPAAVMLALLMARLQKAAKIQVASAVIGQPASEYGRRGMDELHDQTINLLSFQQMPTDVFGTQISFNALAQSMPTAHPPLAETERRILRHYNFLGRDQLTTPAMMLVQLPVFHGYTVAMFVLTEEPTSADALQTALVGPHIIASSQPEEFPSNVNIAGVPDILASVRADGTGGNGYWVFAACDNLRVAALQAVECAEEMLHTRPRGQLQ